MLLVLKETQIIKSVLDVDDELQPILFGYIRCMTTLSNDLKQTTKIIVVSIKTHVTNNCEL